MIEAVIGACISLGALGMVLGSMERAFPARRQRFFRPEWGTDALFFLGQYFVFGGLTAFVLAKVDGCFGVAALSGLRPWSAQIPLPLRALLALALGDVCIYWFHRACHRFDFLWRFHAVHHSSERLDFLAAYREHPFDGVCTVLLLNLPGIAIGLPFEALGGLIAFRGAWAIFIHSNVRVPLGPLRVLFGAPELHHYHHARVPRTLHNFANLAPWLDVLFGTYYLPSEHESYELGLTDPWPRGYVAQLLRPFGIQARWLGADQPPRSEAQSEAASAAPPSTPAPQGLGGPVSGTGTLGGRFAGSTH